MNTTAGKYIGLAAKTAIAAGIIGALVYANADGKLLNAFREINPVWLIPAAALYAFHVYANAWRWHLLLRAQKIPCSLREAVSLTFQSFFFSLVIPGGAIGGDLVRVAFLTRKVPDGRKFDGAFTILMDRFTGMIGIFLVALAMLPFCMKYLDARSGVMRSLILLLVLGSAAGLAAAVVVFRHRSLERFAFYRKFGAFADRWSRGLFSKVTAALDTYSGMKREIVVCILASVVFVNLTLGCVAWCVCMGFVPGWNAPGASLGAITIGNIAGLLPLTPSGVGARDFFVIPILEKGGMNSETALAAALCITALILAFNLLGGVFFLFSKHEKYHDPAGTASPEELHSRIGTGVHP